MSKQETDAPAIVILGLGLIGGSLGMRLRSRGWKVSYLDPNVTEEKAIASGGADRRLSRHDGSGADVIMLAAPLDASLVAMGEVPPDSFVTSVCGLMTPLIEAAGKRALSFIAGHPMAGSEERSIDAARIDLFEGKRWFVGSGQPHPLLERLIADAGATSDAVDAAEHDQAMLLVSHLPQLLSTALAAHLGEAEVDLQRFGGSGLRTFLRLAGSAASTWDPLFEHAAENLNPHLDAVHNHARTILSGHGEALFTRANNLWNAPGGRGR